MRQIRSWAWIVVGAALTLQGCSTFQLTEGQFKLKGKKVAVVAGLTNPSSLQAAEVLADELSKTSRFQVMPPKQVAQSIPNYPQLVKGPYQSAYFEIDVDYARTDLARVQEIHKHVGTDYLYLLWAPSVTSNGNRSVFTKNYSYMRVIAQLFEHPGGNEVGHGTYTVRVDEDKNTILRDDLHRVAMELAEKTRTLK